MKQAELTGKAQTVLGLIDADSLGITLPHEHLLADFSMYFVEPIEASQRKIAHEPVSMENLWYCKARPDCHLDDYKLMDEQLAIKETLLYKWAGGSTIVELTCSPLLGRDPLGLMRIARATGLNIIMGAGYYVGVSHPPELAAMSEEEITEEIVRDIMVGVGNTGVRAGIIGEIGCSDPLEETERKVLRACAAAQRQTGAAINIHPSSSDDLALENIKILAEAGADLSRVIVSHVDAWGFSRTTLHRLVDAGCYIEYDNFGIEELFLPLFGRILDLQSDTYRLNDVIQLISEGCLNHILVSGDHHGKHCLATYGGYGYAHIPRDIVPVMRSKGMSDEQIHTLLVENPKRVLPFAPVPVKEEGN